MKYLKKLENWSNRYDFLENGPNIFVCYFPNGTANNPGTSYIWYHNAGDTDTVDGYTYVFYDTSITKNANSSYTIRLDKPLVSDITLNSTVEGSLNGVHVTIATISYAAEGATNIYIDIPTTIYYNGQQITIKETDNLQLDDFKFTITQPNGTYISKGIIIFTE